MKETEKFLNNILKKGDVIVVGVSGGPDSMCLLHVLKSLQEKYCLNIICAHVNHGLRKESEQEQEFVKNYCLNNNIIFEYMKITKYVNNKFSEQEGREKRYTFFQDIIKKHHANYLMTAHHGDDLIETILMRLVRGSNLKGYLGISKISNNNTYQLVRPLLYCSKKDILNYLEKNRIEYVIDKSNNDEKYTRNRYRKQVLPFLKYDDKDVHKKFLEYNEELEETYQFIDRIVNEKYMTIKQDNYLDITLLKKEEDYLIKKIVEKHIEEIQKDYLFNINREGLKATIELIKQQKNKTINLADNFIARKSYNKLYIEKNKEAKKYQYELISDLNINNKYYFEIINKSKEKSNYVLRINSKDIKLPIIVRSRKLGDKIKVKNLNGTKKIKDIFIDNKIDLITRDMYPIVTDSNNIIIWVPGLKKSIFDKEINEKYDIIIKYTEGKNE